MFKPLLALCLVASLPALARAEQIYGGTRVAIDLGDYQGFVLVPPQPKGDDARPWVWYAPVIGKNPGPPTEWLLSRLLADGFYIVGVNVGESMGNPAGRAGYTKFYEHVVHEYKLEPKARLLAQSRGGLMLYNWAVEHPEKVRCIAGIYAVGDLRSYPKLGRAAEAYGMTPEELEKQLAQHNPVERLAPLAKADVPLLHIHGDVDKLVPLERNSGAIHDRYTKLGGRMELIVVKGKGHEAVPEFFTNERMLDFLKRGELEPAAK